MNEKIRHKLELPPTPLGKLHLTWQPASWRILLSFIGGTITWVSYLLLVYALNSLTCYWGWFATPGGGFDNGLKITQLAASMVALLLIAYFARIAYKEGKQAGAHDRGVLGMGSGDESLIGRDPLLGFITLLVNGMYALIIVVSLVPILMLPGCMR